MAELRARFDGMERDIERVRVQIKMEVGRKSGDMTESEFGGRIGQELWK